MTVHWARRRLGKIGRVAVMAAIGAGLLFSLRLPSLVAAATPAPTPDAGGDTRSVGEGPGLVGAPVLAIGGVILLGIVSAGLTVVYVRATETRRPLEAAPDRSDGPLNDPLDDPR